MLTYMEQIRRNNNEVERLCDKQKAMTMLALTAVFTMMVIGMFLHTSCRDQLRDVSSPAMSR